VSSAEATTVSFDGRQRLVVDLEPLYVDAHGVRGAAGGEQVDDIALRMRTRQPNAHLLASSSRHVTADLLTVVVADGRISVDIRTALDHKVIIIIIIVIIVILLTLLLKRQI